LPSVQQEPSLFGPSRGREKIDNNVFASDSDEDFNEEEEDSIFDKPLTKASST
jgi:hypothetical protein